MGIQVHGAIVPAVEALCAAQFPKTAVCRDMTLESALERDGHWAAPACRYVTGRLPLAVMQPAAQDRVYTLLRSPRAALSHWLKDEAPAVLAQLAQQGLRYEIFREFFSPGFDDLRLRADARYGIGLPAATYADGCTVDEALAQLDRLDVVLDADRVDTEVQRLFIETGLKPPLTLPLLHPPPTLELPPEAEVLLSSFDERFFRAVQARWAALPCDDGSRYARYIDRYCATQGLRIPRHSTAAWPLSGWIGPGWHEPEATAHGGLFRWSSEAAPALEVPLAEPGWYSVRIYTQPHGLEHLDATLGVHGSDKRSQMASVRQENTQTFDAHTHLAGPGWLMVTFEHGSIPDRGGTDARRRGFVLGDVHVRRLSS